MTVDNYGDEIIQSDVDYWSFLKTLGRYGSETIAIHHEGKSLNYWVQVGNVTNSGDSFEEALLKFKRRKSDERS